MKRKDEAADSVGAAAQQGAVAGEGGGRGEHPEVAGGEVEAQDGRRGALADQGDDAEQGERHAGDPARAELLAAAAPSDEVEQGDHHRRSRRDHRHVGGGSAAARLVDEGVEEGDAQQGGGRQEGQVPADDRPLAADLREGQGRDREQCDDPAPEGGLHGRDAVVQCAGDDEVAGPDDGRRQGERQPHALRGRCAGCADALQDCCHGFLSLGGVEIHRDSPAIHQVHRKLSINSLS